MCSAVTFTKIYDRRNSGTFITHRILQMLMVSNKRLELKHAICRICILKKGKNPKKIGVKEWENWPVHPYCLPSLGSHFLAQANCRSFWSHLNSVHKIKPPEVYTKPWISHSLDHPGFKQLYYFVYNRVNLSGLDLLQLVGAGFFFVTNRDMFMLAY